MNSDIHIKIDSDTDRTRKALSRISIRTFTVVGVILLFISVIMAFGVTEGENGELDQIILISSFGLFIPLLAWLWIKLYRRQASLVPLFENSGYAARDLLLVVPLILFSLGFLSTVLLILSYVDENLFYLVEGWLDTETLMITGDTGIVMAAAIVLLVGIIGPFFEEVVFRGLMVERLGAKYGLRFAVIFSSVLFGVLHIDVVGATLFGFAMALLYLRTGSLFAPTLIHMLNNLLALFLYYLSARFDQPEMEGPGFYQQYGWFWVLILVVSTAWLVWYIIDHWYLMKEKEPVSGSKADPPHSAQVPHKQ